MDSKYGNIVCATKIYLESKMTNTYLIRMKFEDKFRWKQLIGKQRCSEELSTCTFTFVLFYGLAYSVESKNHKWASSCVGYMQLMLGMLCFYWCMCWSKICIRLFYKLYVCIVSIQLYFCIANILNMIKYGLVSLVHTISRKYWIPPWNLHNLLLPLEVLVVEKKYQVD